MSDTVYRDLLGVMQKRGGGYAGMDVPEFFAMVEELFTPEQAELNNVMTGKRATAEEIAAQTGREVSDVEKILESMADNGLCIANRRNGSIHYQAAPFMPGILEYQFMRGTTTDRDKTIARLIDDYKKACDTVRPPSEQKITFPGMRVITVDKTIEEGNTVQTYDQVKTYIDKTDSIATAACYCRQKAMLLDEDLHEMPLDVCMTFGPGADFVVERLGGRKISKDEAMAILDETEDAGLIHMTRNVTDRISFLCNCDRWHCVAVTSILAQAKPGKFFNSGFDPHFDPDTCTGCELCLDRCPATALELNDDYLPVVDFDRCFGCASCATGCVVDAVSMVNKPGFKEPPKDDKSWLEAFKASREEAQGSS